MEYTKFKEAVMAKARQMGLADYELYYQGGESTTVGAFAGEINEFSATTEGGACFRCIYDGKMGYASTEALTLEQAESVVERAMDNAQALEAEEAVFLCQGGKEYASVPERNEPLPSTEELVSIALKTQQALLDADDRITSSSQAESYAQHLQIAICNSKGLDLQYVNNLSRVVAVAVAAQGEEMANDFQVQTGSFDKIDVKKLADKTCRAAIEKLGGQVAPTGVYPVVFSPEAMSNFLSTYSGIFSAENAQKGLSKLGDKEGQKIACSVVTLVDDPFCEENPMPIPFDGEGSPTYRKNVIEAGTLNTLLYNLKTAAVAGKETTGNGAKSSYDATVSVRPFTMYLAAGQFTEEQLLEQAQNGVYINSLGGLHAGANPITGDFSLQSAGFMIEGGKKTVPVKSFTVAGNFYDLLMDIVAVGNNRQLPTAWGMTAYGSPSVLVKAMSVAGK